jgi:hypothetical protein
MERRQSPTTLETNVKQRDYTGSCFIAVVGPDISYEEARDSIEAIQRRKGDSDIHYARATKGYEARQLHINNFLESQHDFLLLLDRDMQFAPDTLERLRDHKLPLTSGFYMRRSLNPVAPVWYRPSMGKWPMEPWVGPIERNKLHKIGASGWGCILVHREVVLAVRELLKGEWEVLEDDMDVWPYDLANVMRSINGLAALLENNAPWRDVPKDALKAYVDELRKEIRPLRADREIVGSDIRFAFFALQAGYPLYGDPEVHPGHVLDYPLSIADYEMFKPEQLVKAQREQRAFNGREQRRLAEQCKAVSA